MPFFVWKKILHKTSCFCPFIIGSGNDDYEGSQNSDRSTDNFHVIGITHINHQAACRLFVIAIEHMDNLLSEWFPQLDNHINACGVRRLSFCNLCLDNAIEGQKFSSTHLSKLSLFEVEQVLNCLKKSEDLVCPFHESKVLDIKMMFPDLVSIVSCYHERIVKFKKFRNLFIAKILKKLNFFYL